MRWPVNPLRGKTTDWRAVCGRSACTVRRGEGPNSISPSYPYRGLGSRFRNRRVVPRRPSIDGSYKPEAQASECLAVATPRQSEIDGVVGFGLPDRGKLAG